MRHRDSDLTEPDLGQMGVAPTRDQAECLFDSVEEKLLELLEGVDGDGESEEGAREARLAALMAEFRTWRSWNSSGRRTR